VRSPRAVEICRKILVDRKVYASRWPFRPPNAPYNGFSKTRLAIWNAHDVERLLRATTIYAIA
jgi:hypothetical protein